MKPIEFLPGGKVAIEDAPREGGVTVAELMAEPDPLKSIALIAKRGMAPDLYACFCKEFGDMHKGN